MTLSQEVDRLIEAALDQRNPSPELKTVLNAVLEKERHKDRANVCYINSKYLAP